MRKKTDLDWDDVRPQTPLHFGVRSNGEFFETPTPRDRLVERLVLERAEANARRLGMDRRSFLGTAAGMATTLSVIQLVHGCGGDESGEAGVRDVECDLDGAREVLGGDHFVVDVQSHHIDNSDAWRSPAHGSWTETNKIYYTFFCYQFQGSANAAGECPAATPDQFPSWIDPDVGISALPVPDACRGLANHAPCLGLEDYVDLMFRRSDTAVAVLSTFPAITCEQMERFPGDNLDAGICGDFLPTAAMARTRDVVNERAGSQRCLSHAAVFPNPPSFLEPSEKQRWVDEQLRAMEVAVTEFGIDAWKCYTPFGSLPREAIDGKKFEDVVLPVVTNQIVGEGWFLDDEWGLEMIRKAIELGRPIINVHKGIPLPSFDSVHTSARDVGVVAKRFPDARFVVYHSGLNHGQQGVLGAPIPEGAYDETLAADADPKGIDTLVHSLVVNGITAANNANVYAELGGPGARAISDPIQGTHIFGKLLRYVGEDRILWGTDAIWGGSPQSLIDGFRAFRMDRATQDAHRYPELTDAIKAKILGLNAAKLYGFDPEARRCTLTADAFHRMRAEHRYASLRRPRPVLRREVSQGPRTRREFFALWHSKGWRPA